VRLLDCLNGRADRLGVEPDELVWWILHQASLKGADGIVCSREPAACEVPREVTYRQ
jgi:hypothetical protein